jgi:hypothetical protein
MQRTSQGFNDAIFQPWELIMVFLMDLEVAGVTEIKTANFR